MELSELHEITLQVLRERYKRLKDGQTSEGQFRQDLNAGQVADDVAFRAYKLNLWNPTQPLPHETPQFAGNRFPLEDAETVRSILWQLVGLGMLVPRMINDERNQFFDLSAYGKQVLAEAGDTPYDPLGFMKRLRAEAISLEDETFAFVREALDCYLGRHLRAAAVMIGLASENEILKTIDLFQAALDPGGRAKFGQQIEKRRNLKERFDYLYERLLQNRDALPIEIRELDTWLAGIFQVIRLHRNDAGHPTGQEPTREAVYANLNLFLTYARNLSILKQYLAGNACAQLIAVSAGPSQGAGG